MYYKQGQILIAKGDFSMVKPSTKRKLHIKKGEKFVITSPSYNNIEFATIDRFKSAKSGQGYIMKISDIATVSESQ